jgi:hypothetical protein
MATHYEELRPDNDESVIVFSALADTDALGTAITTYGYVFTPEQTREAKAMLTRCNVFLNENGVQ